MRSRVGLLSLVLTLTTTACGGDDGQDQEPNATTAPEASATSDQADVATTAPVTESGNANLVVGDMTLEFDGLACYYEDEAAEMLEDKDATFAAVALNGDERVVVSIRDKVGIPVFEVVYVVGDGTLWHMSYTEVENEMSEQRYVVENGQVTARGDFDHIVDQEEVETVAGSLEASCG